jgi:hypothetical protein
MLRKTTATSGPVKRGSGQRLGQGTVGGCPQKSGKWPGAGTENADTPRQGSHGKVPAIGQLRVGDGSGRPD